MVKLTSLVTAAAAVSGILAHPGEHHDHEEVAAGIAKRDAQGAVASRSLAKCSTKLKYRQLQERAMTRRFHKAEKMRRDRGIASKPYIMRRDLATLQKFEAVNHNYTSSGYSLSTEASILFGANTTCILTAEVTEGPYYVSGEYIRSDVTESQEGVPLHVEFQIIDVATCEPVQDVLLDIWNANATGVYSGVIANGNGNSGDATNINNTALRGMQATDEDGVAAFDTIFNGHYAGRTSHTHVMAHQGGTILPNASYSGGIVSHVGQLFWDEALKKEVEATYPYNTNTQAYTTNDQDSIAQSEASNNYDPFPEYAYLGDDVTDGLIAWISIGIDTSAAYNISTAVVYGSGGGVAQTNAGGFGGGPGGGCGGPPPGANGTSGGNGTFPSGGAPPSGAPPGAGGACSTSGSATSNGTSIVTSSGTPPASGSSASAGPTVPLSSASAGSPSAFGSSASAISTLSVSSVSAGELSTRPYASISKSISYASSLSLASHTSRHSGQTGQRSRASSAGQQGFSSFVHGPRPSSRPSSAQ